MLPTIASVLSAVVIAVDAAPVDDYSKLLAGGSAAALVAGLFVFAMRHTTASHEKCTQQFSDTVQKSTERFAETVTKATEQFGETTTVLMREGRESHERREQALHELVRELRK